MQLFFEEDGVFKAGNVMKKDGTGIDPDAANGVIAVETRGYRAP